MIHLTGCVMQCRFEVLSLKIWEIAEDLLTAQAGGKELKDIRHPDPHSADSRLAATLLRVVGDPLTHEETLDALLNHDADVARHCIG